MKPMEEFLAYLDTLVDYQLDELAQILCFMEKHKLDHYPERHPQAPCQMQLSYKKAVELYRRVKFPPAETAKLREPN
jgi:hypothetical protein